MLSSESFVSVGILCDIGYIGSAILMGKVVKLKLSWDKSGYRLGIELDEMYFVRR